MRHFVLTSEEYSELLTSYLKNSRSYEVPKGWFINFQQAEFGGLPAFAVVVSERPIQMAPQEAEQQTAERTVANDTIAQPKKLNRRGRRKMTAEAKAAAKAARDAAKPVVVADTTVN